MTQTEHLVLKFLSLFISSDLLVLLCLVTHAQSHIPPYMVHRCSLSSIICALPPNFLMSPHFHSIWTSSDSLESLVSIIFHH